MRHAGPIEGGIASSIAALIAVDQGIQLAQQPLIERAIDPFLTSPVNLTLSYINLS